jgi:hypothetical protein
MGKWDGTGQGQVKGRGKDMGSFDKVLLTGGNHIIINRKGTGGNRLIYPNLSTLLTLSLCRSYRDPTPSLFSKEVKSKQCSNCGVILRYGT